MILNDISFARNFDKQIEYKSRVHFLLSYEASLETKNCNFAAFRIHFEEKTDVLELLENINVLTILMNCYPSCFETIIKIDAFKLIALDLVNNNENLKESYNLLINADYGRLKANLKTLIESSTKNTTQIQTQLTFF